MATYESFEDGDMSEYSVNGNDGLFESGTHNVVNDSSAPDGDYYLSISTDGQNGSYNLQSTSVSSPQAGTTFEYFVYLDGNNRRSDFGFALQSLDSGDMYRIRHSIADDYLRLYGSDGTYDETNTNNLNTGEWSRVEVDWSNSGDITATFYDTFGTQLHQLSISDSTWKSGGLSFGGQSYSYSSGADIRYDGLASLTDSPSSSTPSLTYNADDSLDLTVDAPNNWGGNVGSYEIEMMRDGGSYVSPNGGPSNPSGSSSSETYNYGPNSDYSYDSVVGVDSSFKFRVRATNSAGDSSWSYTSTVYTTPVPPHNPSVSRPDANTVDLTVTKKSENLSAFEYVRVEYREDTGSGYGSWTVIDEVTGSGDGSYQSGEWVNKGDTMTMRFNVGETYQYSSSLSEDARYQFRVNTNQRSTNQSGYATTSESVYADYGNEGNVFFEDNFESGDFSNWGTFLNDGDSGVYSGNNAPGSTDAGISSADEGTYYGWLESGDNIYKQIGDLSVESDVIVKCAIAAGSMDNASEVVGLEWDDGSSWRDLHKIGYEYNKQGWVEICALVPNSWLSTDNSLRLKSYGGTGDYVAFDRVVVSDILHEYTKPVAPSGLSLDSSTEREITATWNSNTSLPGVESHFQEFRQRPTNSGDTLSKTNIEEVTSYTTDGLLDGEKYDIRVDALYQQYRNGGPDNSWRNESSLLTTTTILPKVNDLSIGTVEPNSTSVNWTPQTNYGDQRVYTRRTDSITGLNFTGGTDNVDLGNMGYSGPVSVSVLFRKSNTNTEYLLDGRQSGSWWFLTNYDGHDVNFNNLVTWNGLTDDEWTWATAALDNSGSELFINGNSVDTGSSETIDLSSVRAGIRYSDADTFNGDIGAVIFHTRRITSTEATEITNGNIPQNGLLAYLPFDHIDDGITYDISKYSNNGSVNGPTITGPSVESETPDEYFDGTRTVLPPTLGYSGDQSITVFADVKVDSGAPSANNIFGFGDTNTGQSFSIRTNGDGSWRLYHGVEDLIASSSDYYGERVRVVGRYDASNSRRSIWLEGTEIGSDSPPDANFQNNDYIIGGYNDEGFNGDINYVGVIGSAVSDSTINNFFNYNRPTTDYSFEPSLGLSDGDYTITNLMNSQEYDSFVQGETEHSKTRSNVEIFISPFPITHGGDYIATITIDGEMVNSITIDGSLL